MEQEDNNMSVDAPPPRQRYSLGFNPMEWTVGAGIVVAAQFFVIAMLAGALLGLVHR